MTLRYSYSIPENLKPNPKPDLEMMWDVEKELFEILGECCLFDHIMYGGPLMKDLIESIIFSFEEDKFPPWTLEVLQNFYRSLCDEEFRKKVWADSTNLWVKKLEVLGLYPSIQEFDELQKQFKSRHENSR